MISTLLGLACLTLGVLQCLALAARLHLTGAEERQLLEADWVDELSTERVRLAEPARPFGLPLSPRAHEMIMYGMAPTAAVTRGCVPAGEIAGHRGRTPDSVTWSEIRRRLALEHVTRELAGIEAASGLESVVIGRPPRALIEVSA